MGPAATTTNPSKAEHIYDVPTPRAAAVGTFDRGTAQPYAQVNVMANSGSREVAMKSNVAVKSLNKVVRNDDPNLMVGFLGGETKSSIPT